MSKFYFAWVDPSETTFGPEHHVTDERIYTFTMDHTEGNCAQLTIDIQNPRVGLLNPGRKVWAWFSYDDGNSHVTPIFFGRLVGIPTNVLNEVCTLSFIAKSLDFTNRKQIVAESLKVRPYYDPIWINETLQDDADTILEAYSALWHIDRTTHDVTISDIIVGEDGDEEFTTDEAFYDSVSMTLQQPPLVAIQVNGIVNWTQVASGLIDFSPGIVNSESGADILQSWPAIGTDIGGGWSVDSSSALDQWGILGTQTVTRTGHFQNKMSTHTNGDTMTIDNTITEPVFPPGTEFRKVTITDEEVGGIVDPGADPPVNIPASANVTYSYIPTFIVPLTLVLKYQASRPRVERVSFTLQADCQAILSLPADLDHPQWKTSTLIHIGDQVINNQNLYVATGFISAESPDPTQGFTGPNGPTHLSGAFSDGTPGYLQENSDGTFTQFPGGPGVIWTFVSVDSASDQELLTIQGRNVDLVMPGEAIFELPSGSDIFPIGSFIGNPVPNGSPIGDPSRRSYFPTDRGQISIQYLLAVARAHLLLRSRAVQVKFDCTFERGLALSCRKNARLFDHRLPGGVALGKIINYQLTGDGDAGKLGCAVTIGCAVGFGNAITEIVGDPVWCADGYIANGYQARDGELQVLGTGDIGYSRPIDRVVDDGLTFPLSLSQVLVRQELADAEYTLEIKPVVNGPFGADYFLTTTKLTIPQQINLEAHST